MHASIDDGRFWDRAARKYARSPIKDMAGYERTLDRTAQLLRGSDTVLELGCGTGTTALRLAPHVARIVAIDASQEMIAIAREKAVADGCHNVEFTAASADRLSAAEGTFDAVLAFNLLHLLADRPSVLAQVRRLLKPGGHFVSKTPCLSEMNLLIRWAVPAMRLVGKAPYVSFFTAAELEADIAQAGFTVVERVRHGSQRKDPRIFIMARKPVPV
ncbi:class I SAM-dependent methyltransferase [Hyphomicrobium sp. CS1BSMeth3]|uniref:class I SAM-dependent methyltransferase n=1 Tax=Hyphomicrobium sp. CS1BSMeth3 TaxID=1892844 RepID=UPI000931C895|nr:class I SAM-dependent methyltransferase [Hyphomicrobium sp. CS1BSMeth3]